MESLNRGECDAVGVHHRDRLVVVTEAERRVKVLRHRPDVANGVGFVLVAPRRDRHCRDLLQDALRVDVGDVALHVAIAGAAPRRTRHETAHRERLVLRHDDVVRGGDDLDWPPVWWRHRCAAHSVSSRRARPVMAACRTSDTATPACTPDHRQHRRAPWSGTAPASLPSTPSATAPARHANR